MKYIFLLLFLIPCVSISAKREIEIKTSNSDSLFIDDSIYIHASLSGFIQGENIFIKGVFTRDNSSNSFGYTRVGDQWIKQSASIDKQRQVIVGSWDELIELKPDGNDSGYAGSGKYIIKIGYYYITQNSSRSGVNWSVNTIPIMINAPTPSNTPLPSVTPTKKQIPSPTIFPTITPTVVKIEIMTQNRKEDNFSSIESTSEVFSSSSPSNISDEEPVLANTPIINRIYTTDNRPEKINFQQKENKQVSMVKSSVLASIFFVFSVFFAAGATISWYIIKRKTIIG